VRRLLLLAVAAAAVSAVPANAYLLNGCQSGDWTVADVVVAGREIAQVCTSDEPVLNWTCRICPPLPL
jgi:adenine deaminase